MKIHLNALQKDDKYIMDHLYSRDKIYDSTIMNFEVRKYEKKIYNYNILN